MQLSSKVKERRNKSKLRETKGILSGLEDIETQI